MQNVKEHKRTIGAKEVTVKSHLRGPKVAKEWKLTSGATQLPSIFAASFETFNKEFLRVYGSGDGRSTIDIECPDGCVMSA